MRIGLNVDQLTTIEKYLEGMISEEELDQIAFTDLSQIKRHDANQFINTMEEFVSDKKIDAMLQFFNAQFAVGHGTGYYLCSWDMFRFWLNRTNVTMMKNDFYNPVKMCATFTFLVVKHAYNLEDMLFCAKRSPQVLRKAIDYFRKEDSYNRLVLCAGYFLVKYPDDWTGEVEKEDQELLRDYEQLSLFGLNNVLKGCLSAQKASMIMQSLQEGHVNSSLLSGKVQMNNNQTSQIIQSTFVNFRLSKVLKDVMQLYFYANTNYTLNIIWDKDTRGELARHGWELEQIFDIAPAKLITWAADKQIKNILEPQFQKHKDRFMDVLRQVDYQKSTIMMTVLQEQDPDLYETVKSRNQKIEQERVISLLLRPKGEFTEICKEYLRGIRPIDILCENEEKIVNIYYGPQIDSVNAVRNIGKMYGEDDFYRRCIAYIFFVDASSFFRYGMLYTTDLFHNDIEEKESIERIFKCCQEENMTWLCQLNSALRNIEYLYVEKSREIFFNVMKDIFAEYVKQDKEYMTKVFASSSVEGRKLGLLVYQTDADYYKDEILYYIKDTAKTIREKVVEIVCEHENWAKDIEVLLGSSKAAERELAVRVLQTWEKPEYKEWIKKALEKEKSAKIRAQMMNVIEMKEENSTSFAKGDLVQQAQKGGKKRTIAWAYETPFCMVHKKDGTVAQEEYLQAILIYYASMSPCGISKAASVLAEDLNETEFAAYVNELLDKWIEAGAEAKKKWVLYTVAIHGGMEAVENLHHHIQEWPKIARGAIASEAVQALALSPQPQALLLVDSIARKFKFKQVKAAASKALNFAAQQLGLTREQLEDKIVPTLGFDAQMKRVFDYGSRKFTVTITPEVELEILGEDGKKVKSMPAPGKRDDEQMAAKAYEAFKEMKRQLKTVVTSQRERLESALSTARQWTSTQWQELFVKNPIMHQFAIGLIWGIYEGETLKQSFRYMEDGSFNTVDEEEYILSQDAQIGLVHPLELSCDERKAWMEQLTDYEIKQPFSQLQRNVYLVTEEEKEQKRLERFGGYMIDALSLAGKMLKMGWYRSSVQDAGGYYGFYREDASVGLGVELKFSGSFVGWDKEDVTLYDVWFYKAGWIDHSSYSYDEVDEKRSFMLGEIPARYFSEIVLQLETIVKASKERDKEWKKKRRS